MQHPDEGTIHAWLDGALPDEEARAIDEHVATCASCGERVAEARGMAAAASRILSALDDVPADVVPRRSARRSAPRVAWWRRPGIGMAAAMMIIAFGTTVYVTRDWQGVGASDSETLATTVLSSDSQVPSDSVASRTTPAPTLGAELSFREQAPAPVPATPPAEPSAARRQALTSLESRQASAQEKAVADSSIRREAPPAVAAAAETESVTAERARMRQDSPASVTMPALADMRARAARSTPAQAGAPAVVGGQTLTRTAASLAGCYAIQPRQAGDVTGVQLPSTVELTASTRDAAEAANRIRGQNYSGALRPVTIPPAIDTGQLGWRIASDDSVAVRLATEGRAVLLTFPIELSEPQLGFASAQALPGIPAWGSVVLVRRVPCP